MNSRTARRRVLITYAALYLVFTAAALRAVLQVKKPSDVWVTIGLLAVYLLLLVVEPPLIARRLGYLHIVNALQVGITLFLLWFVDRLDFFALLLIVPCAQSILHFPRKTALAWIGATCLLMIPPLLLRFPPPENISYIITYINAIFFFTVLSYLAREAEEEKDRSEVLLVDLQKANRQLQAYAAQVQELAAAEERNRLARELHDSVTQIIFGLTLSAQAARILMDRDPKRAAAELDHLQALAQNALAEMRALIQQLHPRTLAEEGLAAGLRRLGAERQANDGLTVDLRVYGERRLPVKIEEELFHVAQEALNNIVKHARTDHAVITLHLDDEARVRMGIEDEGVGFDPGAARALPGHLGLTSMAERIEGLGGTLAVDSKPGKGTRVQVDLALAREVEHA